MSNRDVFWSVTPEYTHSPYIRDIARSIEAVGWHISPLTLRAVLTASRRVAHIQWPEHVSRGQSTAATMAKHVRALALLAALSARKHVVVLTAHNRQPHQGSDPFDRWFRRALQKRAAATVVLVDEHEAELRGSGALHPSAIVRSIPHPVVPEQPRQEQAPQHQRRGLILLGKIHPYHLIAEFVSALERQNNSRPVLITGSVADDDLLDHLITSAARLPWLTIRPGFEPDEALAPAFAECAALVSLQNDSFNSGAPYHALGINLPTVVSAGAQAIHLARNAGEEWVFAIPEDVSKLDFAELDAWLDIPRSTPSLDYFAPERVAALHVQLYEDVLASNS